MRAFKLLGMVLIGLMVLISAQSVSAAGGWVVQASPAFIFNGENVTATVTGIPNTYAFVQLVTNSTDETGNATVKVIDDRFLQLDKLGVAETNFTVPIDAKNGVYVIHVVYNGEEVANTTCEVMFDENLYNRYIVEDLRKDLEHQNALLLEYGKITKAVLDREQQVWFMGMTGLGMGIVVVLVVFLMFRDFIEYKATASKRKDGLTKAARLLLHPPARGDIRPYLDHLDGNIRERMERIEGREQGTAIRHPFVLFPDPESPDGYGVAELRDDGLNEVPIRRRMETRSDPSPDTVPDEGPETENETMSEELAVEDLMRQDDTAEETTDRPFEPAEEEEAEPEYSGDIGLVPVSEDVEDRGHFVPLLPDRPKKRSRKEVPS